MSFLGEIKRRKAFRVAAVYVVAAWLIIQVVAVVNEPLNLPGWLDTVVIVLLVVGFPVAVVLSWALDISSRGKIQTEPPTETESDATNARPAAESRARVRDVLPNSVAVLPFENLSLDQNDAFFAVGIHEAVLNQLVKISDLHVMARTSVLRYADGRTPIPQIAEELRVQAVMEGSVQYADDRVRITAQLIDAQTGAHLWSEIYDRISGDIFAVQTDIAIQIASALEAELTPLERRTLVRPPTKSSEAYAHYLKAISSSTLAGGIEAAPEESANLLHNLDLAIELDPDFSLAYALKGREYAYSMSRPVRRSDELTIEARDELALENSERALSLDPTSGVAYAGMAAAHRFARRNTEAVTALKRALVLSPHNPRVLRDAALFDLYRGRYDSALEIARRLVEVDPGTGHFILGVTRWPQRDFEGANAEFQKVLSLAPNVTFVHLFLGWIAISRDDRAGGSEALRVAERLGVGETGGAFALALLAMGYHELGRHEDALRVHRTIEKFAEEYVVTDSALALAYLAIDDVKRGLSLLNDAINRRGAGEDLTEAMIAFDMLPLPILEEPEFAKVRKLLPVAG